MEIDVIGRGETGSKTPAVSLEISAEIAEKAEKLLSDFAEDAGLETALIVDRSGALVAGISSEEDVTVDVISGLVAGASSAMRALVDQLGDTGEIESLHQGGKRLLYIREVVTRFVLVGVSDASFPPGIVREKASQLQPLLADLLRDVKPLDPPPSKPVEKPKSLRAVAAERAAARVKVELVKRESTLADPEEVQNSVAEEPASLFEKTNVSEDDEQDEEAIPEVTDEEDMAEETTPKEPVGVLEPIDVGEPEIVIEGLQYEEVEVPESPFEIEVEEEVEEKDEEFAEVTEAPTESIFELEEEETDVGSTGEETVFEWIEEEEEDEDPVEEASPSEVVEETAETVFEFDESTYDPSEEGEEGEEPEEIVDSSEGEPEQAEEEDTESRSAGPLYF